MNDALKIYIDRLRDGHKDKISETLTPSIMGVLEDDLKFTAPIKVDGEVYLADKELILQLNISTTVSLPCRVCNETVAAPICIEDVYQVIELSDVKGAVYNLEPLIREMILLEAPSYIECNDGACSSRTELACYLKKDVIESTPPNPFAELSMEKLNNKKLRG